MSESKITNKQLLFYRVNILFVLAAIFALTVIFTIMRLNFSRAQHYKGITDPLVYKTVTRQAERGDIKDAEGNLLATTVLSYNVYFDTNAPRLSDSLFYGQKDSLASLLSRFNRTKTATEYSAIFESVRKDSVERNVIIATDITPAQLEKLKTFPILKEKNRLRSGFVTEPVYRRKKPYGKLLKRTIGSLREEKSVEGLFGESGIEGYYNEALSGTPYKIKVQKIGDNEKPVSDDLPLGIERGYDLITAVDINLQNFAHKALKKQLIKSGAHAATLVVMETETGYVKAMVNLKNNGDSTVSEEENYAAGYSMAPGSTFKVPVAVALLEDGYITAKDKINTSSGYIRLYGEEIKDYADFGSLNIVRIIAFSSNVAMAKMVNKYYSNNPDRLISRLYDLGLAKPVGIDVMGEKEPIIRSAKPGKSYNRFTLVSMSYGYGLQITPLGLLTFYNALANDGYLVKPRLVKAFEKHGRIVKEFKPYTDPELICSQNTIEIIKKALIQVVEHPRGTAHNIRSDKYQIAGKTGTVKYFNAEKRKFIKKYRASFVGFFPAERPKYSMIVKFYGTEGENYAGSSIAAPVFRTVSDFIYKRDPELNGKAPFPKAEPIEAPYSKSGNRYDIDNVLVDLGIAFAVNEENDGNWIRTEKDRYMINYRKVPFSRERVPNAIDMSAKDAIFLLESFGLDVQLSGAGAVRYQSVKPGTPIKKNMTVTLELR